MIKYQNVTLSFQNKSIFKDFNAQIPTGSFVSFKGESGRGKSSLLKLVQGYVLPDSGSVIVDDQEVNHRSIHQLRKKMAWIPQNINLPVSNGNELIDMMEIHEKKMQIHDYLEKLHLTQGILSESFSKISGGQKQRIIIALALSLEKSIVLMDEPTSSLDDKSISNLVSVIESLTNTTILAASHNLKWLDHSHMVIEL